MCHPLLLSRVYLRIGSLSTRDPPLSPLSLTDREIVFGPSLPPSPPPPGHTATPILRFLRTERACDNLLGRSSGPRLTSLFLSLPSRSSLPNAIPPASRSEPESSQVLPVPRLGSYHPFFSFLYLIAALFMPGPANKHMNARAFPESTRP